MKESVSLDEVPFEVKPMKDGMCCLTFMVSADYVQSFALFLSSMTGLMGRIAWKYKSNPELSLQRMESQRDLMDNYVQEYTDYVVEYFQRCVSGGEPPRTAMSLTVSAAVERFPQSTYDKVKQILTKAKLLKNTGFYKKR